MREEFQRYGDHGSIFMLDFSSLDSKIDAVKIRFLDISSAKWNGLGPRPSHDLKEHRAKAGPSDCRICNRR